MATIWAGPPDRTTRSTVPRAAVARRKVGSIAHRRELGETISSSRSRPGTSTKRVVPMRSIPPLPLVGRVGTTTRARTGCPAIIVAKVGSGLVSSASDQYVPGSSTLSLS